MTNEYNRMEAKEAKKDGFRTVRNSGRGTMKGDAKSTSFLIDYKFNAKSFTLSLKNWMTLKRQAWNEGQRNPLIVVKFEDGTKVGIVQWDILVENGVIDGID